MKHLQPTQWRREAAKIRDDGVAYDLSVRLDAQLAEIDTMKQGR